MLIKVLTASILAFSLDAYAHPVNISDKALDYCAKRGAVYAVAASLREEGYSKRAATAFLESKYGGKVDTPERVTGEVFEYETSKIPAEMFALFWRRCLRDSEQE